MRKVLPLLLIIFPLALSVPKSSHAALEMGIALGDEGIRSFYLAVGDYYRVPEPTVIAISKKRVRDDELPVVFFIAQRARVSPSVIVDLRLRGTSWWDISLRYGIGPEVYYVPVKVVKVGPPYGKAYGYYKKWPRHRWHEIRLVDADIINLVNLRFMSEYHALSPEYVMELRSGGSDFKTIHVKAEKEKKGKGPKEGKGNGNGKGHGKGKKN